MLAILEAVEFRWTINEVLAQPESWSDDIFAMKSMGEGVTNKGRREAMKK